MITIDMLLQAFHIDIIIKTHAYTRMRQRGITSSSIEYAIENDDLIEQYPDDYPLPSVLLLGNNREGEPLHIVCAPTTKGLIIITSYIPSGEEWSDDWKTRLSEGDE